MGCITIVHHHHLGEYVWVTFSKRFKKIPSCASILSYLNSLVLVCPLIGIDKSFWIVKGTIMIDSTNHSLFEQSIFCAFVGHCLISGATAHATMGRRQRT